MFYVEKVSNNKIKELIGKYFIQGFIGDDIYDWDDKIASLLNLTLDEYQAILLKHNAFMSKYYTYDDRETLDSYFNNKEDVESAIQELEPYLIMAKLSKGE